MKKALRALVIASAVVAGAGAIVAFDYLQHGGLFKTVKPHFGGTCASLPLTANAEDIRIDARRGIAYLSSAGTITLLDLNVAEPRPRAALATQLAAFRPRGMSLYVPEEGPRRLFVVNDPGVDERTVELFEETATGAFAPLETIRDPLIASANAIAAVGPRQFYVANDSGATNRIERLRERLFRSGFSTVTYFDGEQMRVVADGLRSAGGIAVSNHGLWVYVSETAADRLHVFDRDSATGALESRTLVELGSAPDNITIDAEGTVWVAAHPKLLALRRHLRDAARPSPTAIYRLRTSVVEKEDRLSIPYLDLGDRMSAGSVAAVHAGRMLIGSLTEHKVLACKLQENL